jgi:phage-related minor tail protein
MANRIKGLTVEIDGSTTGLDKALKNVNSTIRNTQTQLKDVQRLLKLDPSNTELLSQKQRLLKDAIGETKEKLETLKTAQEQAKKQLEEGTLGQDKYDALQREIEETEQCRRNPELAPLRKAK